jgi:hypothetical protein
MFQIHKLRLDWELMPTALKLELLMQELEESNDKALATLTGLDQAVVARCKKLLYYPKKYQEMMLRANPGERVKADFFIELYPVIRDRLVTKLPWFRQWKFVNRMLEKYQGGESGLKAVTDFRKIKQHIANARRAGKERVLGDRLREFMDDDKYTLDHLAVRSADVANQARKLAKEASQLAEKIADLEATEYYSEEHLWSAFEKLVLTIQKKLKEADRRPK